MSCGGGPQLENTDLVETGTYEVKVNEVDMENEAIYVKTGDGKVLGLKFTKKTELTQSDQSVSFNALRPGQTLEIRVRKNDRYLEPLEVKIIG